MRLTNLLLKYTTGALFALMTGTAVHAADPLPYPEAALPDGTDMLVVTIGPGGPGKEFGSSEPNGGFLRIAEDGTTTSVVLPKGVQLINPTGLLGTEDAIYLTDGATVIALDRAGGLLWQKTYDAPGAFLYDIEMLEEGKLLLTDFGNGALVVADIGTGAFSPFPFEGNLPGIARAEVRGDSIIFTQWGSDESFDGAVNRLTKVNGQWALKPLSGGFGNPEAIAALGEDVLVASYRGHENFQGPGLFRIDTKGTVTPLPDADIGRGASDFLIDHDILVVTRFKDGTIAKLPLSGLRGAQK